MEGGVLSVVLTIIAVTFVAGFLFARRRLRKPAPKMLRYSELLVAQSTPAQPQPYSLKVLTSLIEYHRVYMESFLAKPHADLGRTGVVCPFIPTSIKKDCIYYGAIDATKLETAAAQMMQLADQFRSLPPTPSSKEEVYKTVIVIFPALEAANVDPAKFVDDLQRHLKPRYVSKGLMIGAFYPESKFSGLHNKSFFPRAAPLPSVDIRLMVPEDLKFLTPGFVASRHSQAEAEAMLKAYIARFEPTSRVLDAAYAFLRDLTGAGSAAASSVKAD